MHGEDAQCVLLLWTVHHNKARALKPIVILAARPGSIRKIFIGIGSYYVLRAACRAPESAAACFSSQARSVHRPLVRHITANSGNSRLRPSFYPGNKRLWRDGLIQRFTQHRAIQTQGEFLTERMTHETILYTPFYAMVDGINCASACKLR